MSSSQFKNVLLEISKQLSKEELEQMKFLSGDFIFKKDMEKVDAGFTLFRILMERGKLGEDNTDFLCDMLRHIHRLDLITKVERLPEQPDSQNAKLNIAIEEIAKSLGRKWRTLGRKLALTEVELDSIARMHPTDLQETVVEMLKKWRKNQPQAGTEELIKALRDCEFNLTADKVEERLKDQ